MFNSLLRRAQESVEDRIGSAVDRVLVVVPFVISAGFVTASATAYLVRMFGAEPGLLCVAAFFGIVGVLGTITNSVHQRRRLSTSTSSAAPEHAVHPSGTEPASDSSMPMSDIDKELLMSAATTAVPLMLPQLIRMVWRNLPLFAALASALYVGFRAVNSDGGGGESSIADPSPRSGDVASTSPQMQGFPDYASAAE